MGLRVGLYDRVSTELQARYGISVAAQKEDLYAYAQKHGYEVVGFFCDDGITARKKLQNRKGFLALLDLVKQDKIDLILVTKLDRWFRNVRDYHNTQAILEQHHCNWKTIYEDYDTSTADGQLKINIMLAVAQNECDRTSERIKVVFKHKLRNQEHLTGVAPYGYLTVNKKLCKDPDTAFIVDDIIQYYFSCFSKRKTVNYITNKYQDYDKKPSIYQINRILSAELYSGFYNNTENYHPAYMTREQFVLMKNTSDTKSYPHTREPYIFSGLLVCPICGGVMSGIVKKQKLKDGSVSLYKRYRCSRKYSDHSGPCISETVVEQYMLDHLCFELSNVICELKKGPAAKVSKVPELEAEMRRLNLMFQKGRITDEYYETQYALLESALDEERACQDTDRLVRLENLQKEFSGNWRELYSMLDASHKNAFWKRCVKNIYTDKNTHKLCGFSFV